jgi:peptide/nickel transport system substrate-binding protein
MNREMPRNRRSLIDRLFAYLHGLGAADALIIIVSGLVFLGSLVALGITLSEKSTTTIAARGGVFTEGVVGTPRFINPVLALTRADRDMSKLIYAGLARLGTGGTIEPDAAESITVSEDGLVYNVLLRSNVFFHDGTPLTTDDVAFTIAQIQNPQVASPLRASWDGVSVEVISPTEINFVIKEAYAPFIENLTVGILPQHIWKAATSEDFPFSQFNSEPIGAGPYKIKNIVRNASGIPESYVLIPHREYHHGAPQIETVAINFYSNEDTLVAAFNTRKIDSAAGLSPDSLVRLVMEPGAHTLVTTPLPRTFAVFFNQNKSTALRNGAAREALNTAVNKHELVNSILKGYADPLASPVPQGFGIDIPSQPVTATTSLATARRILEAGGWSINPETGIYELEIDSVATPLAFSIATINTPVFTETAEYLRQTWQELGASVEIKQFEQSDLTQAIIRPRDYEALLFGTVVGRPLDFYSFWHSSQQNDPGLNIALYANITTDAALQEARTTSSSTVREAAVRTFAAEIAKETPAIFLYNPRFTYVLPTAVTGATFQGLGEAYERFSHISEWYIETDSVWSFFTNL